MAEINLSQNEADVLIAMEKIPEDDTEYNYPGTGGTILVPLISIDKRENFILDVHRSRIDLLKGTYQNRARQVIVLVRLDFGSQPHRNPDGQEIPAPHLHLYREGYGDKYAIPVPKEKFSNLNDLWTTLQEFMFFCNITKPQNIKRDLFV